MTQEAFHVLPVEQRLNLLSVLAHAKPVVLVFMFLMVLMLVAAVAVWVSQLAQQRRSARLGENVLSSVLVAAPLFGLTAAAYDLLDMSIGIANVRPSPDLVVLAPGFAEASLCILLGLLAASVAAAFRAHLRLSADRAAAA